MYHRNTKRKPYKQRSLAKIKEINTKLIIEQEEKDGMREYRVTSNRYHQKKTK